MNHTDRLLEIIHFLRTSTDGCAWTKQQTHTSLSPYLIEESYETVDAIDQGKTEAELCGELGDVLLQIALHAQIASERNSFTFDDVAKAIVEKLTRRYPTILGDEPNTLKTAEDIDRRWEEVKAEERRKKGVGEKTASVLDDVSPALPALLRAAKLKGRASRAGWEWPDVSMLLDKIVEETRELRAEITAQTIDATRVSEEFGDLLFMMMDFARWHGIDAEDSLRQTNSRFERRFRHMEQSLKKIGKDFHTASPDEQKSYWDEAKRLEKCA